MRAPSEIIGRRHDKPEANQGQGCFCGCRSTEGRTGTLVEDSDTPKLIELGMAIYEFPADRHPTADFPRLAIKVCYHLDDLAVAA